MDSPPNTQAHLFTLRIWLVNEDAPALEWRGRVQNLQSGEVNYCRNWDALIACIEETLRENNLASKSASAETFQTQTGGSHV